MSQFQTAVRPDMSALRVALLRIAFGAMCLAILPIASRNPLIFADTKSYYVIGQQIFAHISPEPKREATAPTVHSGKPTAPEAVIYAPAEEPRMSFTTAGARSPTFSVFLYGMIHFVSAWGLVVFNIVLVSATLYLLSCELYVEKYIQYIYLGLGLFSGLPEMAAFLMPDIYGVTAIICMLYFAALRRFTPAAGFMFGVLAFSLSCHTSNLLIAGLILGLGVLGLGVLGRFGRRTALVKIDRRGLLALTLSIVTALGVGFAYKAMVWRVEHFRVYNPPFVTARLYADGPGKAFAIKACSKDPNAFEVCRYIHQRPETSDDFLWHLDPQRGVFKLADFDSRVRLINEQARFVIGTVISEFPAVVQTAFANFGAELAHYEIDDTYHSVREFFTDPNYVAFQAIMPGGTLCASDPDLCAPKLNPGLIDLSLAAATLISIGLIIAFCPRAWDPANPRHKAMVLAAIIILANAAICGTLSTPTQRYQLRVNWLYLFIAALCLVDRFGLRLAPKLPSFPQKIGSHGHRAQKSASSLT